MNVASIGTTLAAAGTQTLAIGSSISTAITAVSIGIMKLGKVVYCKHLDYNDENWQKTALKVGGMALMILGGIIGLASSAASGAFSAVGLGTLGSTILGPIGTKVGLAAGVVLGIGSAALVLTTFATCLKSSIDAKSDFKFNHKNAQEAVTCQKQRVDERQQAAKARAQAEKDQAVIEDFNNYAENPSPPKIKNGRRKSS